MSGLLFPKILEKISYRHNITRVFDDFLQAAVCALCMGSMEDRYKDIVSKYEPDEAALFGQAFGALLLDYETRSHADGKWDDLLGDYFMEISSRSSASDRGQFFTPVDLCNMMAQLTVSESEYGETINDPACGSSRNLIAHSRLHPDNRMKCFYVANDLDARCINMSVINYVMYGLRGAIIHMNTLTLEVYSGYRVFMPETAMMVRPLSKQECFQYVFGELKNKSRLLNRL